MKQKMNKMIVIILILSIIMSMAANAFATSSEQYITTLDGIESTLIEDSETEKIVSFTDSEENQCTVFVDKQTGNMEVEVVPAGDDWSNARHFQFCESYNDKGDEVVEIIADDDTKQIASPNALAAAIPVWMGLSPEAVAALIAMAKALSATVITTSIFVLAEELYQQIKKSDNLYYEAFVNIKKHLVYVGDEISRKDAICTVAMDSKTKAVFCKRKDVAVNLAQHFGGVRSTHKEDCVDIGQWPHVHCNEFPNTHIFYPN